MPGGGVAVCVEEALDNGVIISALEVIPARLFHKAVATRAFCAAFSVLQIRKKAAVSGGHLPSLKGQIQPLRMPRSEATEQLLVFIQLSFDCGMSHKRASLVCPTHQVGLIICLSYLLRIPAGSFLFLPHMISMPENWDHFLSSSFFARKGLQFLQRKE